MGTGEAVLIAGAGLAGLYLLTKEPAYPYGYDMAGRPLATASRTEAQTAGDWTNVFATALGAGVNAVTRLWDAFGGTESGGVDAHDAPTERDQAFGPGLNGY